MKKRRKEDGYEEKQTLEDGVETEEFVGGK